MPPYLVLLGVFLAIVAGAGYLVVAHLIRSALSKYDIRVEKVRFLSLRNLSLSLPKTTRRDPGVPLVHITVARVGLRFHRWRRPFGLSYVKPLEFFLSGVTVKIFRPPIPRPRKSQTDSNRRRSHPRRQHDPPLATDTSAPSFPESLLAGLFSVSKNNVLVRFVRSIAENVCLTLAEAEVIVDDQVQVALGRAMLYSSVFDLGDPDEQRRQQRLFPLPLSALDTFRDPEAAHALRYVTTLSLSELDAALVPHKAHKRRSIVAQFRDSGTLTVAADIGFDPRICVQNVQWDTQFETLDLFLRPAIHALYKLHRPMPAPDDPGHAAPPPLPDLGTLLRLPVATLRALHRPLAQWVPRQLDVAASLRQLNVYFTFPTDAKGYSSSSENPSSRERAAHSGTLRFSLKALHLAAQVPEVTAAGIRGTVDIRFKVAALAQLGPGRGPSVGRDRRLFGVQAVHLHADLEVTATPHATEVIYEGAPHRYRYAAHVKSRLVITSPFVDVGVDDVALWESFVAHVRQTRYTAARTTGIRVAPASPAPWTAAAESTDTHPSSTLGAPPNLVVDFVIPTLALDVFVHHPSVVLRVPGDSPAETRPSQPATTHSASPRWATTDKVPTGIRPERPTQYGRTVSGGALLALDTSEISFIIRVHRKSPARLRIPLPLPVAAVLLSTSSRVKFEPLHLRLGSDREARADLPPLILIEGAVVELRTLLNVDTLCRSVLPAGPVNLASQPIVCYQIDAPVRIGRLRVHLPQPAQYWIAVVLPRLETARERVRLLTRSRVGTFPFARDFGSPFPAVPSLPPAPSRFTLYDIKTSVTLPTLHVEVTVSDHALPLPYRHRQEQCAVHNVVLRGRDLRANFSVAAPAPTSPPSRPISPSSSHPDHDLSFMDDLSDLGSTSFALHDEASPRNSSARRPWSPKASAFSSMHPMPVPGLREWYTEGSIQSVRIYLVSLPLLSASPPPSPRHLVNPAVDKPRPLAKPERVLERVLLIENARFSARTDTTDSSPERSPTAVNVDFDTLHVEYSMSRAYVVALLWARLCQMEHLVRAEWLPNPAPNADPPASPRTASFGGGFRRLERSSSPVAHPFSSTATHGCNPSIQFSRPTGAGEEAPSARLVRPARHAVTVSGALVSLAVWLPLGCNEYQEDVLTDEVYRDVASKGLHRVRLIATQCLALLSHRRKGRHRRSRRSSLDSSDEGEAGSDAERPDEVDSNEEEEERFGPAVVHSYEQELLASDRDGVPPTTVPPVRHKAGDWLVTCQSLRLVGRQDTFADTFEDGVHHNPVHASQHHGGEQAIMDDPDLTTGAREVAVDQDLEAAAEAAWSEFNLARLRESIEEEPLVTFADLSIRSIPPQLLVSPQAPASPTPARPIPTLRPTRSRPMATASTGTDVRWNLSQFPSEALRSPVAFANALNETLLRSTGASATSTAAPVNPEANGVGENDQAAESEGESGVYDDARAGGDDNDDGLSADHVLESDSDGTVSPADDGLVVARLGLELRADELHFRLPHDYQISFVIDNVNNLVKSTRNLLHFARCRLAGSLRRDSFDTATTDPRFASVAAAVVYSLTTPQLDSVHPAAALRPRHESSHLPGSFPIAGESTRRRVQSLHTLANAPPEVSERDWYLTWPRAVRRPKRLPYIDVMVRHTTFTVDDDPFETALGRIYRLGLSEQQARLVREAAFEKTAAKLQADSDPGHDGESRPAHSRTSTGNVDVDAARERLEQYNATNWIRVVRAGMVFPRDEVPTNGGIDGRPPRPRSNAANRSDRGIGADRRHPSQPPSGKDSSTRSATSQSISSLSLSPTSTSASEPSLPLPALPAGLPGPQAKVQVVGGHVHKYSSGRWLHPRIPLTRFTIRHFGVTLAPPPHIRNMRDAALFIRHTDGCTPLGYLYDILVPIRLHLRLGDTRMTLRDYPLPLFHIPDMTELLAATLATTTDSQPHGGSRDRGVASGGRRPLVSILNNKRSQLATQGRLQKERYLKTRFGPTPGSPTPPGSTSSDHGQPSPDPAQPDPLETSGCAWEVKGDLVVAEALSGEESVRVIWVPVVPEGLRAPAFQSVPPRRSLLDNTPGPAPATPNVGFIRVHRTVPPPKFFAKLNIRIHTAPRHLPAASGSRSPPPATTDTLVRPPVQLIWDQSIQPCLTTFSQRLENLTSASIDPSPTLAWWDKLRMLLHGSMRLRFVENLDTTVPDLGRSPRSRPRRVSRNPLAGPGEFWFLMRGSRDPYNTIGENVGFLTIWRGDIQIHIGASPSGGGRPRARSTRSPPLSPSGSGIPLAPHLSRPDQDGSFASRATDDNDPDTGEHSACPRLTPSEPRRTRSISTLIANHDMIVHDVVSILSREFIFAVPILNKSAEIAEIVTTAVNNQGRPASHGAAVSPDPNQAPQSSSSSSTTTAGNGGPPPRVRFAFLPSYRLTKRQQQAARPSTAHADPPLPGSAVVNGLLGYAESIHRLPIIRFEKKLLHLGDGVKFTLGLGCGVNLDVLSNLDAYGSWLFSATPWLSSRFRPQGGLLQHDLHAEATTLPSARDFGVRTTPTNPGPARAVCRHRTHPVRHYEIIMRVPKFAQTPFGQAEYDSFLGFRSDHVHMSMGLRCPFAEADSAPPVAAPLTAKNFIGLSSNTVHRIMAFTPLFASKMLLPIRRGQLFPDVSVKDMKFAKFLKSVKCRLDVRGLDLGYCQHLETSEPDLTAFREPGADAVAPHLADALLVTGQVMEMKGQVGAMDLHLLAVQQSRVLTVDAEHGTVYAPATDTAAHTGHDQTGDRLTAAGGSTTAKGEGPGGPHQVIARQWVIDDCHLEVDKIDVRMIMADFHLFSQSLLTDGRIRTVGHNGLHVLPRDLERLPATDRAFVDRATWQDLGETDLEEAVVSRLRVEPLLYSPRTVYFKQAHRRRDDDPHYHAIPLYRNTDPGQRAVHSTAAYRRDSRLIQVALLTARLHRVRTEIGVQRELAAEMEDQLLNADPATELVVRQTLDRARFTLAELETKRRTIERTVNKLQRERQAHEGEEDPTAHAGDEEDSFGATFHHRFLVHSAYGIWNTAVRDILLQFLYVEETARAFRYFMSMAATKVVRELVAVSAAAYVDDRAAGASSEALVAGGDGDGQPGSPAVDGPPPGDDEPVATINWEEDETGTGLFARTSAPRPPSISQARFRQLVNPRKPRRQAMVLSRATTEDYIEYLLDGPKDAAPEPAATAAVAEEDPSNHHLPFHRARRGLSRLRHTLRRDEDGDDAKAPRPATHGTEEDPTEDSDRDPGLLDDLREFFKVNSVYVEFLNPQVNAALTYDSEDAVVLAAERIQLKMLSLYDQEMAEKDVTNPQDDSEHLIKSRSLFGFQNFQVFAVQRKHFKHRAQFFADTHYGARDRYLWPVWVPMELLMDEETDDRSLQVLEPLVAKTSGLLIYDKANSVRIQTHSADPHLDDRANAVGLHFPGLRITADSRQYACLFAIINDLLVYSVPIKKRHSDQLNTLTLAADITDFTGALANVQFMQASVRKLKELLAGQTVPTSTFAPLNDVRGFRANQREYLAFKEKLRLTMEVITNVQKQRQSRRLREASRGVRVVSRRTQLRIDRVLLSMRLDADAPLCDCHIDGLGFLASAHTDQSVSYALDLDRVIILNRLPEPLFPELLAPFTGEVAGPVDFRRHKMISLRWSALAPVGGITVVEHFELDLFPLRVQVTHEVGKKIMQYFFPEKDKEARDTGSASGTGRTATGSSAADDRASGHTRGGGGGGSTSSRPRSTHSQHSRDSHSRRSHSGRTTGSTHSGGGGTTVAGGHGSTAPDDKSVLEMKSRASRNKTFVYLKVPGARHCVSYHGPKGKNLEDLHGFVFTLPTFEYHNETWSWLELVTQVKKDVIRVALAHTGSLVREKIRQIRGGRLQPAPYAESLADSGRPSSLSSGSGPSRRQSDVRDPGRELYTSPPKGPAAYAGSIMGKTRRVNPLAAVSKFARKLSKTHHAMAHADDDSDGQETYPDVNLTGEGLTPGAMTEIGDNDDCLVVATEARSLHNPSTDPYQVELIPGEEAYAGAVPRPPASHQSTRSRPVSLADPPPHSSSSRASGERRRRRREEEKARLLFGSHYPAGKR
ncbi:Protein SABRE [Tieghemiomyces parasiticus]|uniref:Protein SABRE n=1 Tax=Tieghemiomyces parasiticus TaxID=78921 RepID=A0A9W7ZZD3_9FUNG|nr:Protein SABRE [Tieghemiomyces parasiticus]